MPTPRTPVCQNCAFWRRREKPHQLWGDCQSNPPGVGLVRGIWESNFPSMHQLDVCSRHKFREVFNADQIIELEAAKRFLQEYEDGFKKSA